MFYDLADPKKFVKDIDEILDENGVWCVQISYLVSMLKFNNFYDICHDIYPTILLKHLRQY